MLSDIERLVRTAGQRMMEQFTQELVRAEAEVEGSNMCSECGQKMRYKGQRGILSALAQWRAVSSNSKAV